MPNFLGSESAQHGFEAILYSLAFFVVALGVGTCTRLIKTARPGDMPPSTVSLQCEPPGFIPDDDGAPPDFIPEAFKTDDSNLDFELGPSCYDGDGARMSCGEWLDKHFRGPQ